uniref:NADH dehydrogenase [ubiquinone] 1 beta subcomplex subunit 9 n=1 Tax=Electrophorus electricus TaxID=8005 RepID=A0A4W4HNQ1_ELEEL
QRQRFHIYMIKATKLLKDSYLFPGSPGGTSYERYECYEVPEWHLDCWHTSEKAMYNDYFSNREQWKNLQVQSCDSEALPPAREEGVLPSLWQQFVTRPREQPT